MRTGRVGLAARAVGNLHLELGRLRQHDLLRILPESYARSLVVSVVVAFDRYAPSSLAEMLKPDL